MWLVCEGAEGRWRRREGSGHGRGLERGENHCALQWGEKQTKASSSVTDTNFSLQLISGAFEHSALSILEIYGLYDP